MGSINAMDNYDRLSRGFLAAGARRRIGDEPVSGEHVQVAAIDGRLRVLDARPDGTFGDGARWMRATLMMTERHAIAYQAQGGFRRDYGIAVPYASIGMVSYRLLATRRGKRATIGIRFEPRGAETPMLEFATDIDDAFAYDATVKAIMTACSVGGVPCRDESDARTMDELGLHPVPGGSYVDGDAQATRGTARGATRRDDDTGVRVRAGSIAYRPIGRDAPHATRDARSEALRDDVSGYYDGSCMVARNVANGGGDAPRAPHTASSGGQSDASGARRNGRGGRRIGVGGNGRR